MTFWSLQHDPDATLLPGRETQLSRTGETPARPSFQILGQIPLNQFEYEEKSDGQFKTISYSG